MKMRSIYLIIMAFLFALCSPSNEKGEEKAAPLNAEQQQIQDLQNQVMTVHDQLMPQMAVLTSLKKQLQEKNSALVADGKPGTEDQVIVNDLLIQKLDEAHESMMAWMRGFQKVDLEGDFQSNMNYLQAEREKIQSVKELMEDTIHSAQEALTQ